MRRAWLALLLAPWLTHAGAARAEKPAPPRAPAAADSQDAAWAARLTDALAQRDDALNRVIAGEAALSSARHRHHPRGEALESIEHDLDQAREDLAAAEERFPELVEQARRSGVSPAVLRPFEDVESESPAPPAAP